MIAYIRPPLPRPTIPQPVPVAAPAQKLCPWLIQADIGTYIVRGRARFPEGATPATRTDGSVYNKASIPVGTITWRGLEFEARIAGVKKEWIGHIDSEIMYALYDGSGPTDACRYRIDSFTWEATDSLEERHHIDGTSAVLISRDGVPSSVEIQDGHSDEFERVQPVFKALFAGYAEVGEWQLTPLPLEAGKDESRRHYNGFAPVRVYAP